MPIAIKKAIITHRKGSEGELKNYDKIKFAEIIIVTSSVLTDHPNFENSTFLFYGNPTGSPVLSNRFAIGNAPPPNLNTSLLNGMPYYDLDKNVLYILNSGSNGHSHVVVQTKIDEGEY